MESFFGIPINTLMLVILAIFGVGVIALGISALRNRTMFKMAARNLPRRRANTALTILGLMLAAMIFSASFSTGDTLTYSIRNMAVKNQGEVDIMVMKEGIDTTAIYTGTTDDSYFGFEHLARVQRALDDKSEVAGVAPAIIEVVPVVTPDGVNEPAVTLLGLDQQYMAGFDPLLEANGNDLLLDKLKPGEIYISVRVAEELGVDTGDIISIYSTDTSIPFLVQGIYESGGSPSPDLSMVMPLSTCSQHVPRKTLTIFLLPTRAVSLRGQNI